MFTGISNLVNSTISKLDNIGAPESYNFNSTYPHKFVDVVKNYMKQFNPENAKKHSITSCEIIESEKKDNITRVKRIIVLDMLKSSFAIPESVLYYFSDTTITVEHLIELDTKNKIMTVTIKNITQNQLTFNEMSTFSADKDKTLYKLGATFAVNILFGVNETVKKLWLMQYKSYYEDINFAKKIME